MVTGPACFGRIGNIKGTGRFCLAAGAQRRVNQAPAGHVIKTWHDLLLAPRQLLVAGQFPISPETAQQVKIGCR